MTTTPSPPERFSLKDHLFNRDTVATLADQVRTASESFDADAFVAQVMAGLPERELKQRIDWISQCLRQHLPSSYRDAVHVILAALPPCLDENRTDNDFGDFIHAPYAHFVAEYGCTPDDLEFSLEALREITMRFSAEFAIREFINAFPEATLATIASWAGDPNYHVRRLCSEGTRPSLPWARRLTTPVAATIPILDQLHADPTRYVTRSVANHLNDISKVDPDLTLATLDRWRAAGEQDPAEMTFIVRHATRTLIKKGHPGAMALWGMSPDPKVSVVDLRWTPVVAMGEALEFSFDLVAAESAEVIVDYVVAFQGRAGGMTGRKVFKLKSLSLCTGERARVTKRHPMRGGMTTRQLYPGAHEVQLQINGADHGTWPFTLV
ncbi:MAG TPA: DNA alkylation repair protein [Ornithinibacter sp.]|nr:DNA alkylation repair protein [Ornithinibacter sp.]